MSAPDGQQTCSRCGTFVSMLELAELEPAPLCVDCSKRIRAVKLFPYPFVLAIGLLFNATAGLALAAINYHRINDPRRRALAIAGAIAWIVGGLAMQAGLLGLQTAAQNGKDPMQTMNLMVLLEGAAFVISGGLMLLLTSRLKAVWAEHKALGQRAGLVLPIAAGLALGIVIGSPSFLFGLGLWSLGRVAELRNEMFR
jgi:hypothetical protein